MEPITIISLFIAVVVVCGFGVVLLRTRRQRASENRDQELIERVVRVVGDAFDARLQVGSTELEHRGEISVTCLGGGVAVWSGNSARLMTFDHALE